MKTMFRSRTVRLLKVNYTCLSGSKMDHGRDSLGKRISDSNFPPRKHSDLRQHFLGNFRLPFVASVHGQTVASVAVRTVHTPTAPSRLVRYHASSRTSLASAAAMHLLGTALRHARPPSCSRSLFELTSRTKASFSTNFAHGRWESKRRRSQRHECRRKTRPSPSSGPAGRPSAATARRSNERAHSRFISRRERQPAILTRDDNGLSPWKERRSVVDVIRARIMRCMSYSFKPLVCRFAFIFLTL